MQQRQLRPGDVLDDYCPRERRITNHAIVAMVDADIQQVRCVVCDAEHEFKNAKVPPPRKKSPTAALFTQVLDNLDVPSARLATPTTGDAGAEPPGPVTATPADAAAPPPPPVDTDIDEAPGGEDRPFRRSLIRAQLPRPEGHVPPPRAIPEFTMHQPQHNRGKRHGAPRQGQPQGTGAAPGRGGRRRGGGGPADSSFGPMRSGRDQSSDPQQRPQGNGQGRRRRGKKP